MMKRTLLIVAVLAAWSMPVVIARGQEKADNIKYIDLDKKIVKSCYDAALLGTDIFNRGNFEACYRLYQGTLMSLQPILDYRPPLMFKIKERLERAKSMKVVEAAHELRLALDEIQNEIAPATKIEPKPEPKPEIKLSATLYERLGGTVGVRRLINDVFIIAVEDKKVNLLKGKTLDQKGQDSLKQAALGYINSLTGGPIPFDPKEAKTSVAGLTLTSDEYTALLGIVDSELQKKGIAPADIKDFMAKLETARKDIVELKPKQ